MNLVVKDGLDVQEARKVISEGINKASCSRPLRKNRQPGYNLILEAI